MKESKQLHAFRAKWEGLRVSFLCYDMHTEGNRRLHGTVHAVGNDHDPEQPPDGRRKAKPTGVLHVRLACGAVVTTPAATTRVLPAVLRIPRHLLTLSETAVSPWPRPTTGNADIIPFPTFPTAPGAA